MDRIRTEADIEALLQGAKALAVITAWNELGLFAALAEGPRPLAELEADPRALATTAPVLKHLGLIQGDATRIELSGVGRRLLADGQMPSPRNLEFLEGIAQMNRVMREGGPLDADSATDGGVRQHDPVRTAEFLDRLYGWSADSAEVSFEWLNPLLPARGRVLDVGGGHGRYVRRFVDAGHEGVLFDFPHVIEYARGRHEETLSYLAGNFRHDDAEFGGPYDLIFLSNIVHGEPDAENRRLLARLADRLAPGGWLVLKDMFIDAHGDNPENAVFFGLTMLYYTQAGESPTVAGASDWLTAAGLEGVALSSFGRFQLLRAQKPG